MTCCYKIYIFMNVLYKFQPSIIFFLSIYAPNDPPLLFKCPRKTSLTYKKYPYDKLLLRFKSNFTGFFGVNIGVDFR